ncbi:hypothetical protein GC170_20380 [bacterium]|nr:hypothetical protein [bacterium]
MRISPRYRLSATLALVCLVSLSGDVQSADLITNGGFESGSFAGWTVATEFSGTSYDNNATAPASDFYIQADSFTTPVSGLATLGPASGNSFALADSTTAGANVLIQNFTVPLGTIALNLSFDMFTYDWYGFGATGTSLSYLDDPNQHVRVDLLKVTSPDFSTDPADVILNIFDGLQTNTDPPTWQTYNQDLLAFVTPGSTYRLRFGAVDNQFVLNMGVDNVSVIAVPEPSTFLLGSLAGLTIYVLRTRRLYTSVRTFPD